MDNDSVHSIKVGSSYGSQCSIDMEEEIPDITCDVVSVNVVNLVPQSLWEIPVTNLSTSLHALVDTGASVSLIKQCCVSSSLFSFDKLDSVIGLGGARVQPLGRVFLQLLVGDVVLKSEFLVVPDLSIKHSIILGNKFFIDNLVTLDMKNKVMTGKIGSGEFQIQHCDDGSVYTILNRIPVCAKAGVCVTVDPVEVELAIPQQVQPGDGNVCYYFEPSFNKSSKHIIAEEGIFPASATSPKVLVSKIYGRYARERLNVGDIVGYISTITDNDRLTVDINSIQAHSSSDFDFEEYIQSLKLDALTCDECEEVKEVLKKNLSVFGVNGSDIGCASHTQHKIELLSSEPIRQKPRRFPTPVTEELERQCEELRKMNVIKYSKSPWSAPIVPIRKSDGTLRMCIDYRQLNKITKADRFPIPNLNDVVFGLHGMMFFSSIDLMKGYYQVELHGESTEYTAFSTSQNHYEFLRLPFGLKNAPGAFQREMQAILKSFNRNQVVVYIDDILIMAPDFSQHVELVGQVLETLSSHNIKVNARKCSFFQSEVKFLGHIVGRFGLRKSPEFVQVVKDFPKPQTIRELRSFLGLVNFQRKFIPHCSVISKPLTRLTGGNQKTKLEWTSEMNEAFVKLQELVSAEIELSYPDYTSEHKLQLSTDASGFGAGAVLTQVQNNEIKVICYISMTFSQAQCSYSTIEREIAAIRWAIHKLRGFLYGVPFILYTDHRPLLYMNNMSAHNARIMRTVTELSEFEFEIRYKPGSDNITADILSRLGPSTAGQNFGTFPVALLPGLRLLDLVPGGGDSMVQSLGLCFKWYTDHFKSDVQLPTDSVMIRNILVDEMLDHPARYFLSLSKAKKAKFKLMKLPGHVMPESILLAVSVCFGMEVWCHHEMGLPIVYTLLPDALPRVHLQCSGGVHYNPLEELDNFKAPSFEKLNVAESPFLEISAVNNNLDGSVDINIAVQQSVAECYCSHCNSINTMAIAYFVERPYCALVDTGAQISLISKQVYHQVLRQGSIMAHRSGGLEIVGLGGTIPALGIVEIPFRFHSDGPELVNVFAVIQDELMPYCIILGADFVMKYESVLCFNQKTLTYCLEEKRYVVPLKLGLDTSLCLPEFCYVQAGFVLDDGIDEVLPPLLLLSAGQCVEAQQSDHTLRRISRLVLEKTLYAEWPTQKSVIAFRGYRSRLRVLDCLLWYERSPAVWVVVLPFKLLVEIVLQVHWQMGHLGRNKLQHGLQKEIWHPSLSMVVEDVCSSCSVCQLYKVSSNVVTPPILKIETEGPFSLLAIDLLLLPRTSRGHIGCLVAIDHNTKWLSVIPIKNKQSQTIAELFETRVLPSLVAKPCRVLSDNGMEFASQTFNDILNKYNIHHVYSTPYKPSSNGAVERVNRTVIERLRCLGGSSTDWDLELAKMIIDYNHSWHSALNMSPSDYVLKVGHDHHQPPLVDSETKSSWRLGHPSFSSFIVGRKVLRKLPVQGNSVSNKFLPRYDGPYVVRKVRENGVTYEVSVDSAVDSRILRVHHTQLKVFVIAPPYLRNHTTFMSFNTPKIPVVGDENDYPVACGDISVSDHSDAGTSSEDDFVGFSDPVPLRSSLVNSMAGPLNSKYNDSASSDESSQSTDVSSEESDSNSSVTSCTAHKYKSVSFNDKVQVQNIPVSEILADFEGFDNREETSSGGDGVLNLENRSVQGTFSPLSDVVSETVSSSIGITQTFGSPVLTSSTKEYFWDEYSLMEADSIIEEALSSLELGVSQLETICRVVPDQSLGSSSEPVRQGVETGTCMGAVTVNGEIPSVLSSHDDVSDNSETVEEFFDSLCTGFPDVAMTLEQSPCSVEFFENLEGVGPGVPGEFVPFKGFSSDHGDQGSKDRLASLKNSIEECKGSLTELRRRRRARGVRGCNREVSLQDDNLSVGASPVLGPVTRSKGTVGNLPHVQPRILERKLVS